MNTIRSLSTPTVRQCWASLPAFLTKTAGGMTLAFSSSLLRALQDPHADINMDLSTSSWYVSSIGMSLNIGFVAASCTVRYGRRVSLIISSVPAIIGQLLTCFATNVTTLIVGRVLTGVTIGNNILIGIVYIGECTSPQNRGTFLNMTTASLNLGSLIMHTLGYYTHWRNLPLFICIPFILVSFFAYISPESPSWLAERKQYERSREAFYTLRGRTPDTTREIEELIRAQQHNNINKTWTQNITGFLTKFKKKNFLKPLLIVIVATTLLETSGRHIFPAYAGVILQELKCNMCNAQYTNMVLDVLIIVSGVCASYLIRVMNMRTLLFTSGAATLLVLYCACALIYLLAHRIINEQYSWVAIFLFVMFFVLANLGCTCIPLAITGELFPLEHRVVGSILYQFSSTALLSFFLKSFPLIVVQFEIYGAFATLGVCMTVVLVILYFVLPETKDRTLLEIEEYFNNGKFRNSDIVLTQDAESIERLH